MTDIRVSFQDTPMDTAAVVAAMDDPACGGLVTFEGRVRNHHEGKAVRHLAYEAFVPMAVHQIQQICREAADRWPLGAITVIHAHGLLQIGATAVFIAVASAHRAEAFEACRYVIDELKHRAPIWKKETYQDGTSDWVFCSHVHKHTGEHTHAH